MTNADVSKYITHPYLIVCIGPFDFKELFKDHSHRTFMFNPERIYMRDDRKEMKTFNILTFRAN